ncbi:MAG: serine hydrolase [Actinomycetota bacterium]|nr:serine hydrolase [Actinomycetota bacterium]
MSFDDAKLNRIKSHLDSYVSDEKISGYDIELTSPTGSIYRAMNGYSRRESQLDTNENTIYRIYSMTKPITSIAAMILFERGYFDLNDPIDQFLPSFSSPTVYVSGAATAPAVRPATSKIKVWHLLSHTSGLTYGFLHAHPTDEIYRLNGFDLSWPEDKSPSELIDAVGAMPLVADPGTMWNYSMSTDVLGRLIEVATGKKLGDFFQEEIFEPLGMTSSSFEVDPARRGDLSQLYFSIGGGKIVPIGDLEGTSRNGFHSGGGGLYSTTDDYVKFSRFLLNRGKVGSERLLSPRTFDTMVTSHLPKGHDLSTFGRPIFAESEFEGVGFGLGFSVVMDPTAGKTLASEGSFGWGGMASTALAVDPVEDFAMVFMTQVVPSSTYPVRKELTRLIYTSMI